MAHIYSAPQLGKACKTGLSSSPLKDRHVLGTR